MRNKKHFPRVKNSRPPGERQENAVAFGAVLKAAADLPSKVGASAIERATKAAKAVSSLATKGKEETAKGQGTGHTKLTAIVAEMHKAAEDFLAMLAKETRLLSPRGSRAKSQARPHRGASDQGREGSRWPPAEPGELPPPPKPAKVTVKKSAKKVAAVTESGETCNHCDTQVPGTCGQDQP